LNLKNYANTRPYLYHLTHRDNLKHIRDMVCLFPAAVLMERARRTDLMRTPRRSPVELTVDGRTIILRDQIPLYEGKMQLPEGYTFAQFVESLNKRIFFWPGDDNGPIDYGQRHFKCYTNEKPIILRIDFQALCDLNPSADPLFCPYNSGSPRVSYGNKSPRGPHTFLSSVSFPRTPCKVVEVTFETKIALPLTAQFGMHPKGPWKKLL
jgi:hypothetical protein